MRMALGTKCFECNGEAHYNHHVIPRLAGGTKTVPLCALCHEKVHSRAFTMNHGELTKRGQDAARELGRLPGRKAKLSEDDKELVRVIMRQSSPNVSALAKRLGVHRATIYRAIHEEAQGHRAAAD
ncbi:MAG TPA: hypothetical protein VLQ80_07155 [Candidatus Saccharimonadia bacterium]|nr:hypothetical protein [Candidatus Saccharimonadia bacterium]